MEKLIVSLFIHSLDHLILRQGDFIIDGSSVAVSAAAPRESDFSPRYGQSASYGLPTQGRHSRRFSDKYGYSPETVSFKNPDYVSGCFVLEMKLLLLSSFLLFST